MTHYFVLRLVQTSDGRLVATAREEKLSGMAALASACAYATENGGAIAFSQQDDAVSSASKDRRIIGGVGVLPADIEMFMRGLAWS
jgi:hypothetical protein